MRTTARLLLTALMITVCVVACTPTQEPAPAPRPSHTAPPKPTSSAQAVTAEEINTTWQAADGGRREVICYGESAHGDGWAKSELPKNRAYPAAMDWHYADTLLQHRCDQP